MDTPRRITLELEEGMDKRHIRLMRAAIERHGKEITMPGTCSTIGHCFTEIVPGELAFWYDLPPEPGGNRRSTRIVRERDPGEAQAS